MSDVHADVLVVTSPGDRHFEVVKSELVAVGAVVVRYNLSDLRASEMSAVQGLLRIQIANQTYAVTPRTSVWWHYLGVVDTTGLGELEARLALDEGPHLLIGALAMAGVRFVDNPHVMAWAETKLHQLAVAQRWEIITPKTLVTNLPLLAREFVNEQETIAKPVSPGIGIAPFVGEVFESDMSQVQALPTMLQNLVVSSADLRVVVVGNRAWTWRRPRGPTTIDWRKDDRAGADFALSSNSALEKLAVTFAAALGLSMSVQDWMETRTGPVFLESNAQGAWLFLTKSRDIVAPAIAEHLTTPSETKGTWPRAIKRFTEDFRRSKNAADSDGIVAPTIYPPSWVNRVAELPGSIDIERRARQTNEDAAKTVEEKASRLVQITLALLTITLALGAYQLEFVLSRSLWWLPSLLPVGIALVCLALSAFEALQVDRVGIYSNPEALDLSDVPQSDADAAVLSGEIRGRRLASWTARHKVGDLMQARAWFTRGLTALIVAGLLAGIARGSTEAATHKASSMSAVILIPAQARLEILSDQRQG